MDYINNNQKKNNLEWLYCIICLYETKSYQATLNKLEITPNTLNNIIESIEKEIGLNIVNKRKDKIEFTDIGENIVKRFYDIFNKIYSIDNMINDGDSKKYIFGAISFEITNMGIFPKCVAQHRSNNPDCFYSFVTYDKESTIIDKIKLGDIDIGFTSKEVNDLDLECLQLEKSKWVFVHRKDSIFNENKKYIYFNKNNWKKEDFTNYNNDFMAKYQDSILIETDDEITALTMIEKGLGIGFIDEKIAAKSLFYDSFIIESDNQINQYSHIYMVLKNNFSGNFLFKDFVNNITKSFLGYKYYK